MTQRLAHATACAITFACVIVIGIGTIRAASQEPRVQSVTSKSDLRARTDDEKIRAKFFDRYGAFPVNPGDSITSIGGPPVPPFPPGARVPTYDEFFRALGCSAPLVVLGRAEPRAVHLNQKETYFFTDYDVAVERWLRPDDPRGASSLNLSAAGGEVTIGGRPTSVGGRETLDATKRYILFLQPIPGSRFLTPAGPPLAQGDAWASAIKHMVLIPETEHATVELDSLANDIARSARGCAPKR